MYSSYLCAAELGHQKPAELQQHSPQSCQQDLPEPLENELPAQVLQSSAPVHCSLPRWSVPVTPWQCSSDLSAAALPAPSACSWLPGCLKTVLKALMASSVNPGLLPRAFLHNSYSHSSCKINRLFYDTGCITQEDPPKGWGQLSSKQNGTLAVNPLC